MKNMNSTRLIYRSTLVEKGTLVFTLKMRPGSFMATLQVGSRFTAWTAPRKIVFERAGDCWELVSQQHTAAILS